MSKAYAVIFNNYCMRAMQNRIEEHLDFKMKIEDDPIKLLYLIRSLTYDIVRVVYHLSSIIDVLTRMLNMCQHENKYLLDYMKQFKQLRDVVKSQIGSRLFDGYVSRQDNYAKISKDATKEEKMKKGQV